MGQQVIAQLGPLMRGCFLSNQLNTIFFNLLPLGIAWQSCTFG